MPLIKAIEMPMPRIELRWIKTGETWAGSRECAYNLVLPLPDCDIRRENADGTVRDCQTLEIGRTRCSGSGDFIFMPDNEDGHQIATPCRDGAHARWVSAALNGIPIYAVFEDHAMQVHGTESGA